MLNNRVLVIGLEKAYLDLLAQIKSEFLFVALTDVNQFDPVNHSYEALVFNGDADLDINLILLAYDGKPVFAIGNKRNIEGIKWISPPPKPSFMEETLLNLLGNLRSPPRHTGELAEGSIVKSKTFPSWGLGVVKRKLDNGLLAVVFPEIKKTMDKEEQICHMTSLRMICTIKEIRNEAG